MVMSDYSYNPYVDYETRQIGRNSDVSVDLSPPGVNYQSILPQSKPTVKAVEDYLSFPASAAHDVFTRGAMLSCLVAWTIVHPMVLYSED